MMLYRFTLGLIATISTFCVASAHENSAQQWATVLNLSGRQRMLTQKMSKETLFASAGIKTSEMQASLASTTSLFETTLKGLRDGDESVGLPATSIPEITAQLDKVKGMYEELKPIFSVASSGEKLNESQLQVLAKQNVPLLVEMNKAVKMYETASAGVLGGDQKSAVVINLAGRQRMLTQKMTKESLLVQLGIGSAASKKSLAATIELFDTTLTGLIDGDPDLGLPGTKDASILAQLGKVQSIWKSMKPTVSTMAAPTGELTPPQWAELSVTNMTLLKEMNKAVGMFAAAAK